MKKLTFTLIGLLSVITLFAQQKQVVNVSGNITSNTTWTADKIYQLSGIVRVQDGVTLTIQPGTVVKGGKAPDNSNATCLLIDRGGKIYAVGTQQKPIVFTSAEPKGQRDYGDWGGLVIFGRANVNKTNPQYEGGVIPGNYGGTNDADSSGALKYVRIEFAGYPFEQDRELNSLTMCGVGNKTLIEYVQCSYNNDDAFEWFGGSVNAKHLVAYRTNDDDWDVDQGFSGKIQFGVSLADLNVADISTKNGFEVDNDAGGTNDAPKTKGIFSNMTVIGAFKETSDTRDALHGRGAHLRRNNEIGIFNSIIMGWREGIRMDGANTFERFRADGLGQLQNNIIAGNVKQLAGAGSVVEADFITYFDSTANNNRKLTANADVKLANPYNYGAPDFRPITGSPALTGASFTNSKLSGGFFTTTTYVGAFDQNDTWADGWTNFDPNNAEYDVLPPVVEATFTYTQDTTTGSRAFTFNNTTNEKGQTVSYVWHFGGGITDTSHAKNPVHTFAANGVYTITLIATASSNTDTTSQTFSIFATGVEDIAGISNISLYPNPTHSDATIDFNMVETSPLIINVVDLTGKIVKQVANNEFNSGLNRVHFTTNDLNNGMYFVRMESASGTKTLRLVVVQ